MNNVKRSRETRPFYKKESAGIPGLVIARAVLTASQQHFCIETINQTLCNSDPPRHTQHYGCQDESPSGTVSLRPYLEPLPNWLVRLGRFAGAAVDVTDEFWRQAIISEYQPGVGVEEHTNTHALGPKVLIISLESKTRMTFRPAYGSESWVAVPVAPGDVVLMSGSASSTWTHAIEPEATTGRRLSITFLTV